MILQFNAFSLKKIRIFIATKHKITFADVYKAKKMPHTLLIENKKLLVSSMSKLFTVLKNSKKLKLPKDIKQILYDKTDDDNAHRKHPWEGQHRTLQ